MAFFESSAGLSATATALGLFYVFTIAFYRLYISPLAQFPGPKLAALTSWYEFYYDCLRRGKFTWAIKAMHDRYGPIVRITPHELHVDDPLFSDDLFSFRAKLDRYEGATRQFGMDDATVFTVPHDKHKARRSALAPFFARNIVSLSSYQDMVRNKVEKLCFRIEQFRGNKQPLNLGLAFKCLATDVISEYALGTSYDLLETPDFSAPWFESQRATGESVLTAKHFPWLIPLVGHLPSQLITTLNTEMGKTLARGKAIGAQVTKIVKDVKKDDSVKEYPTLFHHLLQSNLSPQEKTIEHMTREGFIVVQAGSDTTGIALTVTAFHILNNTTILARVKEELTEALPDSQAQPTWVELEKLSYLSAVIKEGLRLAHGTSNRLPRVSAATLQYGDWIIPPNTPVGMSPMLVHENETIFPNHHDFRPERWLGPSSKTIEKYLMTFGKGPRACLGMNLAYAELYVTLATIFRRFDFELFETSRRDVDAEHDFMVPCPSLDSKGMRVLVKR